MPSIIRGNSSIGPERRAPALRAGTAMFLLVCAGILPSLLGKAAMAQSFTVNVNQTVGQQQMSGAGEVELALDNKRGRDARINTGLDMSF